MPTAALTCRMHLIDSHCHLDFPDFDADRAEVIARAQTAGVGTFINPGCTMARSRRAVALATEFSDIFAAVGVHPEDPTEIGEAALAELHALATHEKVVAIGEIGLDYFRLDAATCAATIEAQKSAFRRQLILARELSKPVILHTREAESDTLAILDEFPDVRGVAHCYTGSLATAEALVARGWLIGFTGIITFKNAVSLREVVRALPLEKILVETDAPYLAPEPHRGKRAEPAMVVEVTQKIAGIKNVSVEEVIHQTSVNTRELFWVR